jgi:hypothetical protein
VGEPPQWIVRIAGRIENVSNDRRFPALFEESLRANPNVTLLRFQQDPWPHANSAHIVITATNKKDAEVKGREIMLQILRTAAADFEVERYGWSVTAGAELFSGERST